MTLTPSTSRPIGRTALSLPVFGFGSAHLGELYGRVEEADSRATLDAAWAGGVRYYDTAPWYAAAACPNTGSAASCARSPATKSC